MFLLLAGAALGSEPLTNDIIIKMVQSGVPTETIVRTIQAADSFRFGTLPGDLMQLQQAKVPEEIIRALAARINWPGTAPINVAHPVLTPLPAAPEKPSRAKSAPAKHPQPAVNLFQAPAADADRGDGYLYRGALEVGVAGSGIVPHAAGGSSLGLADLSAGYFLSRGHMIGGGMTGIFTSDFQNVYLSGNYRYYIKTRDPRLFPFAGGGAGASMVHFANAGGGHNFLAKAEFGVRYFAARHVALDVAYNLQYVRVAGDDFLHSSYSAVSIGFAHIF